MSYEYNFEPETDDGSLVVLSTDFFLTMTLQTTGCFVLCAIGMLNFKTSNRALWALIVFVISSLYIGPIYVVEKKRFEQGYLSRLIWVLPNFILSMLFYSTGIFCIMKQKSVLIQMIQTSLNQQNHLSLILENLEESLIIVHNQKIEFVNDKYLEMFMF